MISKVYRKFCEYSFAKNVSGIRDTLPIKYELNKEIKIVTLLQHSALDLYLVAIKSFLHYFGGGEVHVLNDGSLSEQDILVLQHHVPGLIMVDIATIDTGSCPKGNCWERLFYILQLSASAYVIQLDSDTVSINPLPEVFQAVVDNRCFALGSLVWSTPVHVEYLKQFLATIDSTHVQVVAESAFHKLDFFQNKPYYARGSAAFSGFAKGQLSTEMLTELSRQMTLEIGESKWVSWGSEQVASNVMVAQSVDPFILPWPRYQNYKQPSAYIGSLSITSFIHFIGTYRFSDRTYEKLAVKFIHKLNNL